MLSKVTVVVVTYNSYRFLPELFRSFLHQTFKDFRVVVVDNHSFDESVDFVRKNYPTVSVIENRRNLDFCRATNQGIRYAKSEYVLLCNPDVTLDSLCIEELYNVISKDSSIASVGAKLLKFPGKNNLTKDSRINTIDSTGLYGFRSRRFIDRGEGEQDEKQFDKQEKVFGFSGALALFRKSALEDIAYKGEILDEDFGAYKDDVDLAWRLQSAGYSAVYVPKAIAYHKRSAARKAGLGNIATVLNRKGKSSRANKNSYRNHLLLLVKNLSFFNFLIHLPWIVFYEFRKIIYLMFREPSVLLVWFTSFRIFRSAFKKRRFIFSQRKVGNAFFRKWFS